MIADYVARLAFDIISAHGGEGGALARGADRQVLQQIKHANDTPTSDSAKPNRFRGAEDCTGAALAEIQRIQERLSGQEQGKTSAREETPAGETMQPSGPKKGVSSRAKSAQRSKSPRRGKNAQRSKSAQRGKSAQRSKSPRRGKSLGGKEQGKTSARAETPAGETKQPSSPKKGVSGRAKSAQRSKSAQRGKSLGGKEQGKTSARAETPAGETKQPSSPKKGVSGRAKSAQRSKSPRRGKSPGRRRSPDRSKSPGRGTAKHSRASESWCHGDTIEVYSRSAQGWLKVIDVDIDNGGKTVTVAYRARDGSLRRKCLTMESEDIRRWQPQAEPKPEPEPEPELEPRQAPVRDEVAQSGAGSTVDMMADPHAPTDFTMEQWCFVRDQMWKKGAPFKADKSDPRRSLYRASLAMNLMQENYHHQMGTVGAQGRLLAERAVRVLPGKPLVPHLDKDISSRANRAVKKHLHLLRKKGNQADHDELPDLVPSDKPLMVHAAYQVALELIRTDLPDTVARSLAPTQPGSGRSSGNVRSALGRSTKHQEYTRVQDDSSESSDSGEEETRFSRKQDDSSESSDSDEEETRFNRKQDDSSEISDSDEEKARFSRKRTGRRRTGRKKADAPTVKQRTNKKRTGGKTKCKVTPLATVVFLIVLVLVYLVALSSSA
eukprot:COSAG02_NODE_950_length_15694_cov_34.317794_3_plen_663_part_00